MFLFHHMVDKPLKVFVGAYRRHSFWIRVVKMLKIAAFSPLVLLSNNFEKIKYAQKKEILPNFQYKKAPSISKFLTIKDCTFEIQ